MKTFTSIIFTLLLTSSTACGLFRPLTPKTVEVICDTICQLTQWAAQQPSASPQVTIPEPPTVAALERQGADIPDISLCASSGHALPDRLRIKLADTAVNVGVSRAIKLLQQTLNEYGANLEVDGKMGKATLTAVCNRSEQRILEMYTQQQLLFYRNIVAKNPSQQQFMKGWENRARYIP